MQNIQKKLTKKMKKRKKTVIKDISTETHVLPPGTTTETEITAATPPPFFFSKGTMLSEDYLKHIF